MNTLNVTVGEAHLCSTEHLIQELESRGYRVRPKSFEPKLSWNRVFTNEEEINEESFKW